MSEFDDILVAIHGIGEQSRNTTVRSVATRLAHSSISTTSAGDLPPLAPQPLGWFFTDVRGAVKVAPLDTFDSPKHPLARTGFTEVFWADIPEEVVTEGRTLEETKAWARTVVARARAVCKKKMRQVQADRQAGHHSIAEQLQLVEPDFSLAAEVLEEIIETVYVLQNLLFVVEKAGLLKFDLKKVLDEYLGDVQIVTEFTLFRRDIIGRFQSALQKIHLEYPDANLHIVAHSEGTVISFLGLLHALSGQELLPATADENATLKDVGRVPDWLAKVKGYMTIGSPIDKHILVWPRLMETFDFTTACELFQKRGPIKWRNYYDYGDPVGFKLETARAWLGRHTECQPFEFEKKHDIGFARYLLPGKAHNDYWDDADVFEHFIQDVVKNNPAAAAPPKDRMLVSFLSTTVPYALSFLLLIVATFILYRAVTAYTHPDFEPLQRYLRFTVLGLSESPSISLPRMAVNACAIAALLAGVTLLARLPRLATGARWFAWGLFAFIVGCLPYYYFIEENSRLEIGQLFRDFGDAWATAGVLLLSLCVGLISLVVIMPSHEFGRPGTKPRKNRWFRKGMRPLMFFGAVTILLLVVAQVVPHSALTNDERNKIPREEARMIDKAHLNRLDLNVLLWRDGTFNDPGVREVKTVTQVLAAHPPVWSVLLSGAAFLYLWWLAALIFDLAFVWQRYVRNSVANDRLMWWHGYLDDKMQPKVPPIPAAI
ncbi:MAG: hypothetical protein ABJB09_05800 [Verrucomicrobiota bacterium]